MAAPDRPQPVKGAALWFGLFGGVAAWIVHIGSSYLLVPVACRAGLPEVLFGITFAMGAAAAGAVAIAWRSRLRLSGEPGLHRAAFMARLGLLTSGFFLLVILAEGLPRFLLDPCARIHPGAPVIRILGPSTAFAHVLDDVVGPGEAWSAWNFDPIVVAGLGLLACLYAAGRRRQRRSASAGRAEGSGRALAWYGGLACVAIAVLSPLDALSKARFSVHMVQHLLLTLVAAPLLVLGRAEVVLPRVLSTGGRAALGRLVRRRGWRRAAGWLGAPGTVFILHGAALFAWHQPRLYQAALFDPLVHGLEHACFLFTAVLFWRPVHHGGTGRRPDTGAVILLVFATLLLKAFLGVVLTLAPSAWYPAHAAGAALWGVGLLEDQQRAGLLMWIPAKVVYVAAILWLVHGWLRVAGRRAWAPAAVGPSGSSALMGRAVPRTRRRRQARR